MSHNSVSPLDPASTDEHCIIFYALFLIMICMAHHHILPHNHVPVYSANIKMPIFLLLNPELCKILYTETEIIHASD
jgi:hypothetical protein